MVTEDELHAQLEDEGPYSAFPEENGWEVAKEVYEELYRSDDAKGVAKLADTLDREHAPIRDAVVRGEEEGYLEIGAYGYELTDKGQQEFADLFPE
ncbi:MAG: hypothetical protein ABEJ76_09080 [Halanaeroarchaeum sp.]